MHFYPQKTLKNTLFYTIFRQNHSKIALFSEKQGQKSSKNQGKYAFLRH